MKKTILEGGVGQLNQFGGHSPQTVCVCVFASTISDVAECLSGSVKIHNTSFRDGGTYLHLLGWVVGGAATHLFSIDHTR